jgi:hypothetical protein
MNGERVAPEKTGWTTSGTRCQDEIGELCDGLAEGTPQSIVSHILEVLVPQSISATSWHQLKERIAIFKSIAVAIIGRVADFGRPVPVGASRAEPSG